MHIDEEKKNKALIKAEEMADEFNIEEAEAFAQKHRGASGMKILYCFLKW